MMEHTKGRRDLYEIRAYNLQRNASADVVRWCLKDLRHRLVSNFLVICSPSTTNTVLTQVCTSQQENMSVKGIPSKNPLLSTKPSFAEVNIFIYF